MLSELCEQKVRFFFLVWKVMEEWVTHPIINGDNAVSTLVCSCLLAYGCLTLDKLMDNSLKVQCDMTDIVSVSGVLNSGLFLLLCCWVSELIKPSNLLFTLALLSLGFHSTPDKEHH